jgi:hypothetical protein
VTQEIVIPYTAMENYQRNKAAHCLIVKHHTSMSYILSAMIHILTSKQQIKTFFCLCLLVPRVTPQLLQMSKMNLLLTACKKIDSDVEDQGRGESEEE